MLITACINWRTFMTTLYVDIEKSLLENRALPGKVPTLCVPLREKLVHHGGAASKRIIDFFQTIAKTERQSGSEGEHAEGERTRNNPSNQHQHAIPQTQPVRHVVFPCS